MDPQLFYAISAGGGILLLFFIDIVTHSVWFPEPCWKLIWKYFLLPSRWRHRFFGPWILAQMSFQLIYFIANIFCASFRASTAKEASVRIACLLLINMMSVYFGFHSSLICDSLGVLLATYRLFHASTGTLAVLLHVLIDVIGKSSFNVGNPLQMSGSIVSVAVSDKSALPIFLLGNRIVSAAIL